MNPTDLGGSLGLNLVAVTTFVTAWIELSKPFIEVRVKPSAPLHDPIIRLYGFVVAVVTVTVLLLVPPAVLTLFYATVAILAAMGYYHVVNPTSKSPPQG